MIPSNFPTIQQKVNLTNHAITLKGSLLVKKQNSFDVVNPLGVVTDAVSEAIGLKVILQLISSTSTSSDGKPKLSKPARIENWTLSSSLLAKDEVKYTINFEVDADFGTPGAVVVQNNHSSEIYFVSLSVRMPRGSKVQFPCNSWVYRSSGFDLVPKPNRIFFSNHLYLPQDTPPSLVPYREADLKQLQGNGTGIRQHSERIYDYDIYNDLGGIGRPKLGGSKEMPYPRRCRTGRIQGLLGEETYPGGQNPFPIPFFYIPSDEYYSSSKTASVLVKTVKSFSHTFIPMLTSFGGLLDKYFDSFQDVESLYDRGFDLSKLALGAIEGIDSPLDILNDLSTDHTNKSLLKFPIPAVLETDRLAWRSDREYARQLLAGTHPILIQCLTEFPPTSGLGDEYGPRKSTVTEEHISRFLEGTTVQEAVANKKLFLVDLHDIFMPYIERINKIPDIYMYATRTFLFLRGDGTLKPIAIELSTPSSRRVLVPPQEGETDYLWELAKAHTAANDSGAHQLVGHWLKCHACMEPFIIAAHRQLSALHPIFAFLKPHMKYTLQINALGRQVLISASGIAEQGFTPKMYCMELTSQAYKSWKFAMEGLPADLIKRGMAVPDPAAKHGMKLVIEDYPYAADGLEIWSALTKWTQEYVDVHYKDDATVQNDAELQAWWSEVVNVGHGDLKDDPTWFKMDSKLGLTVALTTFIWITTANHAAVNFSQYAYAGFIPNRPTATHLPVPEKGSTEHRKLLRNPEEYYFKVISNKMESFVVMSAIEVLSGHADTEEYIGQRHIDIWTDNEEALEAFDRFAEDIDKVGETILSRNKDPSFKNRHGPVKVPYKALYPTSSKGITGQGVPNSISI
ncbi:lipoxygenase [Selaginella moellendorffii]|uniref:Lipoxygenase n=2 Tax=Selaginella moellendorffii TaxID=88036 RepID=D8SAV0_SELML|nr:lipoxygenase [Selaginella moellendorffii]